MRILPSLGAKLSSFDLRGACTATLARYRALCIPERLSRVQRRAALATQDIAGRVQGSTVTVDFDNGFVRVVTLRGRRVVGWGTAIAGDVRVAPEDRLTGQMAALLNDLRSGRNRLVCSFQLHTTLMRRLSLPKVPRRYRKLVVESEIAETIPFSPDEVDLAWSIRGPGLEQEVLATAVRKEATDRHVARLARLGHHPSSVYSRATALAIAAGLDDAVVVDLGMTSADLVLVRGGVPRVIHSAELPVRESGARAWETAVERAIARLTGHDESLDGDGAVDRLPVVFTGPLAEEAFPSDRLASGLGREAIEPSSGFEFPDHFPAREYAVNLGLARADRDKRSVGARLGRRGAAIVDMLPERHRLRGLPIIPAAAFISLLVLGYVALGVAAQVESTAAEESRLASRLAALERQDRVRKLDMGASRHAEASLREARQVVSRTELSLTTLRNEMDDLMLQMATLTDAALAPDVELAAVVQEKDGFRVSGTALTYDALLNYSERLLATGDYSRVDLLELRSAAGNGASLSFQMQALTYPTLRAQALPSESD